MSSSDEEDLKRLTLVMNDEPPLYKMSEEANIQRKIEEEEDVQKEQQSKNSLSQRLRKYLQKHEIDDGIEIFNVFTSGLILVTFAIGTYYDDLNPNFKNIEGAKRIPNWIKIVEIVLLMIYIADFLLFFFIAENRIVYFFKLQSICSYVSIIPTALVDFGVVEEERVIADYYLHLWKVFRFCSISRLNLVFSRRN